MNSKRAPYTDTRDRILSTGEELILGKGFAALGLAEILSVAEVPKGSFYHYFSSKEDFGVALLQRYFSFYDEKMRELISRNDVGPTQRLMIYFSGWKTLTEESHCQKLCLAVKLAAEVADLSSPMRGTLAEGMQKITTHIAGLIELAQQQGELNAKTDPQMLATSLYSIWTGASLLTKVTQNMAAMQVAEQQTRDLLGLPAS